MRSKIMTMTGTATAVEMNFEQDIVRMCAHTTTLLDNPHNTAALREELSSCTPSLIASKTAGGEVAKVVLNVRIGCGPCSWKKPCGAS
jgi:hypothetical protein